MKYYTIYITAVCTDCIIFLFIEICSFSKIFDGFNIKKRRLIIAFVKRFYEQSSVCIHTRITNDGKNKIKTNACLLCLLKETHI